MPRRYYEGGETGSGGGFQDNVLYIVRGDDMTTSWILLDDDDDYHNVEEDEKYPRWNMSDSGEASSQEWGRSQGHITCYIKQLHK